MERLPEIEHCQLLWIPFYIMAYCSFFLVRGTPKTLNLRLYTRRMPCQNSMSFWRLSKSRLEFTGFRAFSSLLSDEKKRDLLDERAIFIRDIPPKTPNIKEKIREYFSSFGEVENVRRKGADMMFVSFRSVESAKKALKQKHFFEGRWMTTLPNVKKGMWRGHSC